ncbi:MAG: hypothetical protein H6R07_1119 [Proteobacteria bacterium]|nr:hypothetical protein [Pseudomonadota bacterium]
MNLYVFFTGFPEISTPVLHRVFYSHSDKRASMLSPNGELAMSEIFCLTLIAVLAACVVLLVAGCRKLESRK